MDVEVGHGIAQGCYGGEVLSIQRGGIFGVHLQQEPGQLTRFSEIEILLGFKAPRYGLDIKGEAILIINIRCLS